VVHFPKIITEQPTQRRLMRFSTRVVLQVATLCIALGTYGFAADNAYLYVVHGIPGRDVSSSLNPGFPIDVLIEGECQPRGLTFGASNGPLSFSAGTYEVQISEANTLAPCTNPPLADSQVTLTSGASVSVAASIMSGQPTLLQFSDDLSPVAAGTARFVFANTADAPALQATLTQLNAKNPKKFTVMASPGTQQEITVPNGEYLVQVVIVGKTTVLTSVQIGLPDQSATFSYAAGEATNNVLGLVNRTVADVF
jgi:hypothetical protein